MNIDFIALGDTIASIRKEWGFTQKDVYHLTKVSIETQRRIEHGLKEPKVSTLERLSLLYKVDLLKLAMDKRKQTSYFSDEMIRFINRIIWQRDRVKLLVELNGYIGSLERYKSMLKSSDRREKELIDQSVSFFNMLKDFDIMDFRYKDQNIIFIEKSMSLLDSSKKSILKDPYQFNIEITMGLFLTSFYQLCGDYEKSRKLLDTLEASINRSRIKDFRINDYKVTIGVNRVIVYQLSGQYDRMYGLASDMLENNDLFYAMSTLNDLLFLKGIAMYELQMAGYEHLIQAAMINSGDARQQSYQEELERCRISKIPPN